MKKIKLNTSVLTLRKEEISSLSGTEMKEVFGGQTGPCTTGTCVSNTCVTNSQVACHTPSPTPSPTPPPTPPPTPREGHVLTATGTGNHHG